MGPLLEFLAHPAFIAASVIIVGGAATSFAFARRGTGRRSAPEGVAWGTSDPWTGAGGAIRSASSDASFPSTRPNPSYPPGASAASLTGSPAQRAFEAVPRPAPAALSADQGAGFASVAGTEEAIEEMREIKDYLCHPEPFRALGARLPKGILLHGPPGTGKTLLARALAAEANASFYSVSAASFVEVYVGMGASRVRSLFQEAKNNLPAVVFIDELDAVGRRRTGGPTVNEEREGTLNQLLIEMDGFDAGGGVVVVGATNRIDVLDPALLRSGRFDRRIPVELPDVRARAAILRVHAKGKPLAPDVDLEAVARTTSGLSGADLANILNEAALLAARERHREIRAAHVSEALERVVAGPARRARLIGPQEHHRIACHEAGHAVVAAALPTADSVRKVSIVSRGNGGGFTWLSPVSDHALATRSQLLDRLAVLLAGTAAEELFLGEPSSGASDDLQRASELARHMVARLGMHPSVKLSIPPSGLETSPPSENLAARVDGEVESLLVEAQKRAHEILVANRALVEEFVGELLAKETLEDAALAAYLGRVGTATLKTPKRPAKRRAPATTASRDPEKKLAPAGRKRPSPATR